MVVFGSGSSAEPGRTRLTIVYNDKERKGEVCVSILVRLYTFGWSFG